MTLQTLPLLARLIAYDGWANHETVSVLRRSEESTTEALRHMGHIVAAQRTWLGRLAERDAAIEPWPELSALQCALQARDLRRAWKEYLDELRAGSRPDPITYTSRGGETRTSSVDDVLVHVVLHSAHHRARIAAALREAGLEPPRTDFAHAAHKGFLG